MRECRDSHGNRSAPKRRCRLVALLLLTHGALLAFGAWTHSPTWDEIGHLAAGISHWRLGGFDLYRVNPPWCVWPQPPPCLPPPQTYPGLPKTVRC